MRQVVAGSTDQSEYFYVVDDTTGLPVTGLVDTDVTNASYTRPRGAAVQITVSALGSATAAHSDGGFKEVSNTLAPGVYRLDVPDAAYASDAEEVTIALTMDTDYVARPIKVGLQAVDPQDIFNKVNLLGSVAVTVAGPVAASGKIEIVRGDDYLHADGRALPFANPNGTWPDLTGATITFTATKSGETITNTGSVVTPTGSQLVRVELPRAKTNVSRGTYNYDVQATLAVSGRIVTLFIGTLSVKPDVTA